MQLLNQGTIAAILLFGGALAFVLGLVLLLLYKRSLGRHMRRVAAAGTAADQENPPRHKPSLPLAHSIEHLTRTQPGQPVPFDSTLVSGAIYAAAGLIFAIVATFLLFVFSGIQFLPLRTACVVWAYAWPIVLTLNLL